ncbi:MAG: hypothetical protein JOZ94_21945 [Xanthobacteraceae bacterium]|nr:hypothetical protein [Xanthobacteraceae bacterium]MBV9630367.1 hypothetical protein [Xanthobacteraceae bacterium]
MPTWRLAFYANRDDKYPSRFDIIDAKDDTDAAVQASKMMGNSEMRVDVTRTIVKNK